MGINLIRIIKNDSDRYYCKVRHENNSLDVYICTDLSLKEGKSYQFEMSYNGIGNSEIISNFTDSQSGIFPGNNNQEIIIIGKISNLIIEDNFRLLDLYLQNGPEFICIDMNELPERNYEIGMGMKVEIKELLFHLYE